MDHVKFVEDRKVKILFGPILNTLTQMVIMNLKKKRHGPKQQCYAKQQKNIWKLKKPRLIHLAAYQFDTQITTQEVNITH